MRRNILFPLTLGAALSACAGTQTSSPDEKNAPKPEPSAAGLIDAPLGESECAQGEPDARIESVGIVQSGTDYGSRADCPEGYLVDLDNYASGEGGTLLIYSGPNESERERCEGTLLTAYVWEKDLVTGDCAATVAVTQSQNMVASSKTMPAMACASAHA